MEKRKRRVLLRQGCVGCKHSPLEMSKNVKDGERGRKRWKNKTEKAGEKIVTD